MSTDEKSPPSNTTPQPPRRHLNLRPRTIIFWSLILLLIIGPLLLRQFRINQVPLIPEPYDVAAFFESKKTPDSENAYVDYQKAGLQIKKDKYPERIWDTEKISVLSWEKVPDEVKAAVATGRPVLEMWLTGTKKPHALAVPPEELRVTSTLGAIDGLPFIGKLAFWKQMQLQDQGDLEQSWEIIAAGFRCSAHLVNSGTFIERLVGFSLRKDFGRHLIRWSEDPKVNSAELRNALLQLRQIRQSIQPLSENLKTEYMIFRRPVSELRNAMKFKPAVPPTPSLMTNFMNWIQGPGTDIYFGLTGEYELISRLQRHIFANRIAHADSPRQVREKTNPLLKMVFTDETPAGPQLPSSEIERIAADSDISQFDHGFKSELEAQDRAEAYWSAMELILALQLFHRDKGNFPADLQELVPAYLPKLPDNPFAENLGETLLYKTETDHVVLWMQGEYTPVPLEEQPVYYHMISSPKLASWFWTVYPPGTRPPLYRPYPEGFEEALEKKRQAEIEKNKRNPALLIGR